MTTPTRENVEAAERIAPCSLRECHTYKNGILVHPTRCPAHLVPAIATALQAKEDEKNDEIARLREALKPFAAIAPEMRNSRSIIYGVGSINVYCSDFHAARVALSRTGEKE